MIRSKLASIGWNVELALAVVLSSGSTVVILLTADTDRFLLRRLLDVNVWNWNAKEQARKCLYIDTSNTSTRNFESIWINKYEPFLFIDDKTDNHLFEVCFLILVQKIYKWMFQWLILSIYTQNRIYVHKMKIIVQKKHIF